MKKLFLAAVASMAIAAPGIASAATLMTPLDSNNGQSGIMFDIVTGGSALTIKSLGINTDGNFNFEFYTTAGGIGANANNAGAWTLRDTFSNVVGAGLNVITSLDLTDFVLAANSTTGFYITGTVPNVANLRYTNGTGVGNVIVSDANLSILEGYGKSYPFAQSFSPRRFNGSITYALTAGVPEPAAWAMMLAGFGLVGSAMRRRQKVAVTFA